MTEKKRMEPVIFGEVLFDCFPNGNRVLGGAPFNVAWHLQAFNESPVFISGVGNDPYGAEIIQAMQAWKMNTTGVVVDGLRPTGTVDITFQEGEPSYEILDDRAWDLTVLPQVKIPGKMLLYYGSLALRHEPARQCVGSLRSLAGKVFVDINLRPPWYQRDELLSLVSGIDWLKLNEHELTELIDSRVTLRDRLQELHEEYGIGHVVVTRGSDGALLSTTGEPLMTAPIAAVADPVDTVGAGDAFSSVLMHGILQNWEHAVMMQRAQQFAAAIVRVQGATVNDPSFYKHFCSLWQGDAR